MVIFGFKFKVLFSVIGYQTDVNKQNGSYNKGSVYKVVLKLVHSLC